MSDLDMTPYSTVTPLVEEMPQWVPEEERERIAAYTKYEEIYWNHPEAFKLIRRGSESKPIYVPNPRTVVDTTAHFFMKGMAFTGSTTLMASLEPFLKREEFYSRFAVAKHAGVTRGDWVFHLTADETKEDGKRLSLTSLDPSRYFPIYDEDDLDKLVGVHIADAYEDEQGRLRVHRLTYRYVDVAGRRRIQRSEIIAEIDERWFSRGPTVVKNLRPVELLPESIPSIPVYHFKNRHWDGDPFGSSELRGLERILAGVDQSVSDEDVALALEGLGVYATDAGPPQNESGEEEPWEIGPGRVMEVPTGSYFKRVEGVDSVTPMQEHIKYLEERLFESSATFRGGVVDVKVAESGIALAIRFLPTVAKLEQRDLAGTTKLQQLFYDWTFWHDEYEGSRVQGEEIEVSLGNKLPVNRVERISELNNMLDRKVISRKYYRQEMEKYGYVFDDDMEAEIIAEEEKLAQFKANIDRTQLGGGGSNNKDRPNESAGTEAEQDLEEQQRP